MTAMFEDRSVLRWGGLAGMLSPALTLLTAIVLFSSTAGAPADTYGPVVRYPEVKTAYAIGETLSLASVILSLAFYLALCQALRGRAPAPALWGVGLSFLGLAVLAAEGAPRIAFTVISDLYHAPGASAQAQASLALIWQTVQGLFNELDTAALIFQSLAYILFGWAMLSHPVFGRWLGLGTVFLALSGLVGLYLLGVSSPVFAPFGLLVFILLPVLLGWKVFRLSASA